MKKLITVLILILLCFGCVMSWRAGQLPPGSAVSAAEPAAEPAAVPAGETPTPPDLPLSGEGAAAAEAEFRHLDEAALAALYPADEVVLRLADEEIRWGETRDWLCMTAAQIEDYFSQMAAYYGLAADWEGSVGDEQGTSFARYTVEETRESMERLAATRAFARSLGAALDAGELAKLDAQAMAEQALGAGATVEEFSQRLEQDMHMSLDSYRSMSEANALYSKCLDLLYGAAGEKLDEAEAVRWLEEGGYLSAGHILLMTIDPNTGDSLESAELEAKRAKAEELSAELAAITEPEALLRRFAELKQEYCEDGGKTLYPDGYTFTPGTMVTEFEDAVRGLADYGVSRPVQTSYGYHVILRLPLRGDSLLYSVQGTPATARQELAYRALAEDYERFTAENPAVWAEGVETLDLLAYLK